ncbi:beta-ketoacyl synthase N-terminal-like domain-containing protein [Azoarcus taiwanensis]|uniref:3-oxoacyl-[acyl-carrier-protein] synthase 1 n=1 Tax=Azoarcus taiwanensis TaxID=666964 RepID=A0A972F8C1_9RHOO|nr:beta-ketoacyl synthase N-terminal-like domain-containing protein [Azoarcus taiwanensis]NMG03747.1 beta-ketoacyl-ACP synthase I [Azoarcus taiwanensis]
MHGLRRVVVTGMGIVSCLGKELDGVSSALREGRCGIRRIPEFIEHGLRSQVGGQPVAVESEAIPRRYRRFMTDAALQAHAALASAVADAGLEAAHVVSPRTGLIAGSGTGSLAQHHGAMELARDEMAHKISPFAVPQVMGSTVSANLATTFGITGTSYSITSACATSAHCIGHAMEQIQFGKHDIVFAGGAEELNWTSALLFDAMGALSTAFNATPECASRPYDTARDGFVIAGGAGMLVLEELEHARRRGARIYAELAGYGATSDGHDMLNPSIDGAARAMRLATQSLDIPIDYVNTHATSTRAGDLVEVEAMQRAFGPTLPAFSSTKGLTGHPIGAAGVHEAIYTLLMMRDGFVAGCANLDTPDPSLDSLPIIQNSFPEHIDAALSNSFGFGGTNACLAFRRVC